MFNLPHSNPSPDPGFRKELRQVLADQCSLMSHTALHDYVDSIYHEYIRTVGDDPDSIHIISDRIEDHERLHARADSIRSEVLQSHGAGLEWIEVDEVCRGIRDVIVMLEDVLGEALGETLDLVNMYTRGRLMFQK